MIRAGAHVRGRMRGVGDNRAHARETLHSA